MKLVVTLISDWKMRDPYVSMLKGQLLSALPDATLIDITHAIDFSDIIQTAFVLRHSFSSFPDNSVHLILTNFSAISNVTPVLVSYQNHYFIGEDNGIFSLMFGQDCPPEGLQADMSGNPIEQMIRLVKAISEGSVSSITKIYPSFKRAYSPQPFHSTPNRTIEGQIVYIDGYYNAVTNIPVKMFQNAIQKQPFKAVIKSKNEWPITAFHEKYFDEEEFYFVPNALGLLEITMYQGNVSILADLHVEDKVIIQY